MWKTVGGKHYGASLRRFSGRSRQGGGPADTLFIMARQRLFRPLLDSPEVREAAAALVDAVTRELETRADLDPQAYERAVREIGRLRGRPLMFPLLCPGLGRGARVTLADGSSKLDFVSGIGVQGFGHGDRDLLETAVAAAAADVVFQGHLAPGPEMLRLTKALLRHSGRRLRNVWLSVSGAMANENALKIVLQKHSPADRIVVFERAFAGRTLALSELSDRPAFREGLPLRGNVLHVPFYDPRDKHSTRRSVEALEAHLSRFPGQIAAMLFELVQGEGGFHTAPPEFFAALMERCRAARVAVWVDEVQTFGRTGELFAYRTLGLERYVDVATVGKMLQGSAVLFSRGYRPRAGLVAGTFAGSSVGMAVGARIIERLEEDGYLGVEGRLALLARRVERRFEALARRMPKAVGERSGLGAMQAFVPFDGSAQVARAVVQAAFDEGLLLFTAGSQPTKIRLLLPVNTTDEELEAGFTMLEKALTRVGERLDLPC
ncbi:MAG: aminotransferase class III-fold pyridoxal phosphate-dependent enzyme [Myxococcota bacterium]